VNLLRIRPPLQVQTSLGHIYSLTATKNKYQHRVVYTRQAENQLEKKMRKWLCVVCGFIYNEAAGMPSEGIAPGTRWEDVPASWACPECGVSKADFEMVQI
jgi:rubredoxin